MVLAEAAVFIPTVLVVLVELVEAELAVVIKAVN